MNIHDDRIFRRFWYPLMARSRLGQRPHAVSLFLEDMVLWQGTDGVVSALEDKCAHEGVRISPGEVCGDRLVCPHHHWEFDAGGRCLRIPQRPGLVPPSRAHIRPYLAAGRYGLAWVAVEKPLAPIPIVPELESAAYRVIEVLHERWRVSAFRFAEALLDIEADPRIAGSRVLSVQEEPFGCRLRVLVPAVDGAIMGDVTWYAPTTRVLRLSYPSGLQRVLLATAAPLAERWITVSHVEARNDTETDLPASLVAAQGQEVAQRERERLQELKPDLPILPVERDGAAMHETRVLLGKVLRRIIAINDTAA